MHTQRIIIEPPVMGNWMIDNPPGHPVLAFDFLAEDESKSLYRKGGLLRHLMSFIPVEDTLTWSSPVFSPVDGIVVKSHDTENDRMNISFVYDLSALLINKPKVSHGFGAFGGNHIMIRTGEYFVLLCHLRKGSVKVKQGDTVRIGQQLGEVGNSGSSIQPHLHIQIMSNVAYFPLFENLMPFTFRRGKVKQGGNCSSQWDIEFKNKTHSLFERAIRTFGYNQERR